MTATLHQLPTFFLLCLKSTILLAATLVCLRLARNTSASNRHLLCTLSLSGLALLPAFMLAMPSWTVAGSLPSLTYAVSSAIQDRSPGTSPSTLLWSWILLSCWASGAALVLLRSALGWFLMVRERRRSAPLLDEAWCGDLASIAQRKGRASVGIALRVGRVNSALACGVLNPAILVPSGASKWTELQRRAVLLHEVAHLRRHDCFFNYVTQFACALFWFHPLAWKVAANQHREQELACDDAVLSSGIPATEYATILLEGVRSLSSGFLLACAFGGRSRLKQFRLRLAYLLDRHRNHASRPRLAKAFALSFFLILLAVSAVKPVEAQKIYKVGGEVSSPKLISKSEPSYTTQAKHAGIQGVVLLTVVIGLDGRASDIHVSRSLDPGLDRNAVGALEVALRARPPRRKSRKGARQRRGQFPPQLIESKPRESIQPRNHSRSLPELAS